MEGERLRPQNYAVPSSVPNPDVIYRTARDADVDGRGAKGGRGRGERGGRGDE